MRRKLLMLLAIGIGMTSSVWALEKDANGVYQISSAQDLEEFATMVNQKHQTTINAVLTDNINMSDLSSWTAIGDWNTASVTSAYCGHFDGKGHTINNFNHNSNKNYYGIFGVVSTGCLIENLIVEGTITSNVATSGVVGYARDATPTLRNIHSYLNINNTKAGGRVGGILGSSVNGTIVIDRCTYSGTLDGNDSGGSGNYGGIVGYVNNNANAHLRITNCLFDGELKNTAATPGNCTFGGIVGYVGANPDVTITNCLSIGTLQSEITGQFYGAVKHNTCSIINSYYKGTNINGIVRDAVTPTTQDVTKVSDEQLSSGKICYALNGSVSGGENWYQTLGATPEAWPKPYGNNKVYAKHKNCDGTASSDYTNNESDIRVYTEGFCPNCGFPQPDYMTKNSKGYYEISNEYELRWFSAYVNNIDPNVNAVLTSNINLEHVAWTPIGNSSSKYAGTFDGQGYAITNFSYTSTSDGAHGFFGYVSDATIKNFSISGTLTSDGGTKGKNFTGTIGAAEGTKTVISGINSSLTINVSNCEAHSGGILGSTVGSGNPVVVENCEYSGTLTHREKGDCQAGILGYTYNGGVKNCIFSGTIIGASSKYGGILGYGRITSFKGIQNCLSIGKIKANEGNTTAAAIIGNWNGEKTNNVKNNYYCLQEGSNTTIAIGNKKQNCEEPVLVTAEQLESGEVAYKLGSAFHQTIAPKSRPTLDTTHGIVKKITDAKFATTYFSGTDVTIPEDVTAYAAAVNDGKVVLSAIEAKIADGDAVVLNGEEGYYSFVPTTGASKAANNDLKISDGNVATDASNNVYALAKNGTKVGFRIVGNGVKIPAGKAYLKVAAGAGVKEFYPFGEEDATGIDTINDSESMVNGPIYNVSGQRMSKLQKGINIANGKKVLF